MNIIGCDFHSRYQVVAMLDTETGEMVTRRLEHEKGEARAFYAALPKPALIGIEATACTLWFERMAAEFGRELQSVGWRPRLRTLNRCAVRYDSERTMGIFKMRLAASGSGTARHNRRD